MKYFIDTEFIEGSQWTWFGKTKPTIDLISIGIVSEDDREYYAISKDFNLKEAWSRYDLKINKNFPQGSEYNREYWIRENVLFPIWCELMFISQGKPPHLHKLKTGTAKDYPAFTYKSLKQLISKYGKSNNQIAEEIKIFVANRNDLKKERWIIEYEYQKNNPKFYGYYSDYDWVVFCWLFGRMIDLPKGFPMYCIDLKQMLDDKVVELYDESGLNKKLLLDGLINRPDYPKQDNEHSSLDDAKWNKKLYDFINKL